MTTVEFLQKVFFRLFMNNIRDVDLHLPSTFGSPCETVYGLWENCTFFSSSICTWFCSNGLFSVSPAKKNLNPLTGVWIKYDFGVNLSELINHYIQTLKSRRPLIWIWYYTCKYYSGKRVKRDIFSYRDIQSHVTRILHPMTKNAFDRKFSGTMHSLWKVTLRTTDITS